MLWRTVVNAAAVGVATWLLPGISFIGNDTTGQRALTLAIVAIVIGLLNAFVKPVLTLVSSCFVVTTLGLFLWVINAAVLMFASWLCGAMGVGWHVAGWDSAFVGALIVSVVAMLLGGNRDNYGGRN
ncbi:Hypothetical protein PFR_JS14_2050 [Propionibacterium freudenreichii]|uniref:phage holin family protein n=1 Tax=Propionibacterium freudenreichii TaxID=1744 RepID=UPI000BC33DB2|nr:phage holin family protein [Propionibacterium freudenreichii]SBT30209.1 Hypothetical protein PFR_JS14_2050 [Propionibacterium freudenreichii]